MGEILRESQLMAVEASVVIVRDEREYAHLVPNMSRKTFIVSCFIHIDLATLYQIIAMTFCQRLF
jgi:hypothetical protein